MAKMILVGGVLILVALSLIILYSGLVLASREDDEMEKLPQWREKKGKECRTDGNR